jgi:hypothetical protein
MSARLRESDPDPSPDGQKLYNMEEKVVIVV